MTEILLMLVGLEGLIIFVLSYFSHQKEQDINRLRKMLHQCQKEKANYHRELEATNKKAPLLDMTDDTYPDYIMFKGGTDFVDEVV